MWAWLVCVGVGYVCAEGAMGRAGAPWAMQWVEEMLVMPTGSKKKCFSIALRHTLVVLEMH